jgi:tetratricopeptide (TPR) repeat protein
MFLLETGDIESAKEKFNRILELDPDFAAALFYLGEIAFNSNDCERSLELYNRALQKDSSLTGPCYRMAQQALMKDKKKEARAYLVSELKLALEDTDTLVSMGSMFLAIGDLGCATHCLLRAVDIDYANADAYYYLGVISVTKGEFEDAAELFAHTLDIKSEHIPTLRDSASVCLTMGKLTEAAERISKARALDGEDPQLKRIERAIFLARLRQRIVSSLSRFRSGLTSQNSIL